MTIERRVVLAAAAGSFSMASGARAAPKSEVERNLASARKYVEAAREYDTVKLAEVLADEFYVVEYPNLVVPLGQRRDRAQVLKALSGAKDLLAEQTYEVTEMLGFDDAVVIRAVWTGRLKAAFENAPAHAPMKAECAGILRFRDGKLVSQYEYDCYYPLK